jgi:hypothetical protein
LSRSSNEKLQALQITFAELRKPTHHFVADTFPQRNYLFVFEEDVWEDEDSNFTSALFPQLFFLSSSFCSMFCSMRNTVSKQRVKEARGNRKPKTDKKPFFFMRATLPTNIPTHFFPRTYPQRNLGSGWCEPAWLLRKRGKETRVSEK